MIEPVSKDNIEQVLPLIRGYQAFYHAAEINDDKNRRFFCQFGLANPSGCQFLFRDGDKVVGFATVFFSYTSVIAEKVAIMNDLFTVPECRGRGVGRQLIEHCRQFAADNNAVRLQWVTATDNTTAQKLYDSLDTASRDWKFYTFNTEA
jgi:GNAT superfamily N-acetyltransferase